MSNIIYDYLSTPIETFLEKVQVNFLEFQRQDHSHQINAISDLLTKDKDYAPFFKKINLNSEDIVGGRQPISNNFLKSVSIENFKTIKSQTIELNNLNVFIGRNNVGKSNILSFFEFIFKVPLSNQSSQHDRLFDEYQKIKGGQDNFLSYGREGSDKISSILRLDNSVEFNMNFVATDQGRLKFLLDDALYVPMQSKLLPEILLLVYLSYICVKFLGWRYLTYGLQPIEILGPFLDTYSANNPIKNWGQVFLEFFPKFHPFTDFSDINVIDTAVSQFDKFIQADKLIKSYQSRSIECSNSIVDRAIEIWRLLKCCFYEYQEIQNLTNQEFVEAYRFALLIHQQYYSNLGFQYDGHGVSILPDTVYPKFDLPIFHLNNTDNKSPIRNYRCDIKSDSFFLRDNCENLATILLLIKNKYQTHYQFLINHIKEVVLDFNDFELRTNPNLQDEVSLLWTSIHNPNKPLTTKFLSDGSIRFIALATILLMPPELQPAIIVIDEPELGLHPWAIKSLGGILKYAAKYRQIIISTQSPYLLEEVGINHIIAVDRIDKYSSFKRLSEEELKNWLLDFSITELWDMNIIGANN